MNLTNNFMAVLTSFFGGRLFSPRGGTAGKRLPGGPEWWAVKVSQGWSRLEGEAAAGGRGWKVRGARCARSRLIKVNQSKSKHLERVMSEVGERRGELAGGCIVGAIRCVGRRTVSGRAKSSRRGGEGQGGVGDGKPTDLTEAIRLNPSESDLSAWSDGCVPYVSGPMAPDLRDLARRGVSCVMLQAFREIRSLKFQTAVYIGTQIAMR